MKITVEDIERKAADVAAEKANIQKECDAIRNELPAIEAEATAAAEAGNMEAYAAKQTIIRDKETRLNFLEIRGNALRKAPAVSMADAGAAWEGYTKDYSKDIAALQEEYDKTRQHLWEIYGRAIQKQAEMVDLRDRFAGYTGTANEMKLVAFPAATLRCLTARDGLNGLFQLGGTTLQDPDALFYLSSICAKTGKSPIIYKSPEFSRVEYALTGTRPAAVAGAAQYGRNKP